MSVNQAIANQAILGQTIPWKTRSDLQSVEHVAWTATAYTVKDPVKDEYFSFSQVEFFFLKHLRCQHTFQSLIQAAASELGRTLGIGEIQAYLRHLAQDNLIVPQMLGDGDRLFRQRSREQSGHWKQQILGLLSIKLSGFHPGALLPPLKPLGWLLFNPISLTLFGIAVLATVLFAAFSFSTLVGLAPSFSELATPVHVGAILVGFVIAKIIHELGHALACQYAKRECSEMGILLLVFLPVLYCDVSDMWTEKSRWKRILVSLAGVFVELGIAVVCFWIWFLTVPGSLHNFCYSMMMITSINTLFINGNPLMRYDGYYALSDLSRIPNLSSVSKGFLSSKLNCFFLKHVPIYRKTRLSSFLLTYGIGAVIYRWLILVAIAFGIWTFFDYHQLRSIGASVVVLILTISIVPMLIGARRSFTNIRNSGIRWANSLVCFGLLAGLVYATLGLEFSHRIWGQAEVQLNEPNYVFAPADGRFVSKRVDGELVAAGDLIGSIESPELKMDQVILKSQLKDATMNLEFIQLKSDAHRLAGKIEFWKKRESTLRRQLDENELKLKELNIQSPCDGQVIAFQNLEKPETEGVLPKRSGSVFDMENQGCQLNRGDPICYVGQPKRSRGFISVDEKDIELVATDQQVKVAVPFRDEPIIGSVVDISIENSEDETHKTTPSSDKQRVTYRVEIEFDTDPSVRVGSIHQAVIICQPTKMVSFVGRWLRNSFWF